MPAKLKSRLPQIAAELPIIADIAAKAGADAVTAQSKINAPDRPPLGEGLVEAIHTEKVGTGAYESVAGDGDDIFYGHMVEFGTTKAPPHPFHIPAFEARAGVAIDVLLRLLRKL